MGARVPLLAAKEYDLTDNEALLAVATWPRVNSKQCLL